MVNIILKFRFVFIVALLFQMIALPLHFSAEEMDTVDSSPPSWVLPIDYLALGDSLAVGVNSNNELGKGYTDFLAQSFQSIGALKTYNKGFSFPKYTTGDILKDIQVNVTKDIYGIGYKEVAIGLHKSIADAEIITISAGANDVLPLVKKDPVTGSVTVNQQAMSLAIQQVGKNYNALITQVSQINPDAKVYVMGYYNPFPYMHDDMQPLLKLLLASLNNSINTGIEGTGAIFVPTGDVIATDYKTYLPNPENIHLNEAGYHKVTEQFWKSLQASYQWIPDKSFTIDRVTKNSINLNWQPAFDNVAVASYEIYQGKEKIATVNGDIHSYSVNGLSEKTPYLFSIIAVDGAGNKSLQNPIVEGKTTSPASPSVAFSDIADHGLKLYIEQAATAGIVGGYEDGTFKPNQNVTRVQAATIIVRTLGLKTDEAAPFGDIGNYADQTKAAINAAYKYGIIKGNNGNFKPSEAVTRAQLALMIERAYEHVTGEAYTVAAPAPFTDYGNYNAATVNAISMLYELDVATGYEGKFMPSSLTTRAQVAKMVVNFIAIMNQAE